MFVNERIITLRNIGRTHTHTAARGWERQFDAGRANDYLITSSHKQHRALQRLW